MNKQEIQNEINKTKEHLANLEKMLAEYEYKRWKPKEHEEYYIINTCGFAESDSWIDRNVVDLGRYSTYNCFKTKEQAKQKLKRF